MTRSSHHLQLHDSPQLIADATENLSMMLSYTEIAFGFLARLHGDREHDGHLGFEAVCVLCERALSSVNAKEGLVVEKLVSDLRVFAVEVAVNDKAKGEQTQ